MTDEHFSQKFWLSNQKCRRR